MPKRQITKEEKAVKRAMKKKVKKLSERNW
jgi:hypothetical protein